MQILITKKHEYLTGWTSYDMTWKTDYTGVRKNMTLQSIVVVSKEPFSIKTLKEWAAGKGVDFDSLFTIKENAQKDCEKMNQIVEDFNNEFGNGLKELNNDDKCHVRYSATLNPNYKPFVGAFETMEAYNVEVRIEYKSGSIQVVFPSQGRQKVSGCTLIVLSGNHFKSIYGEDEAIEKVKSRIERYINDCDSDEKFNELPNKLVAVKKEMMKYFR